MAAPLPVRLNDALIARIDSVASTIGLNRSDVIRLCLNRFLDDFEGAPEELLRRDWSALLDQFDGRKTRYSGSPKLTQTLNDEPANHVQKTVKKVVSYLPSKPSTKTKKRTP